MWPGTRVTASTEMGNPALQTRGPEFCQQPVRTLGRAPASGESAARSHPSIGLETPAHTAQLTRGDCEMTRSRF